MKRRSRALWIIPGALFANTIVAFGNTSSATSTTTAPLTHTNSIGTGMTGNSSTTVQTSSVTAIHPSDAYLTNWDVKQGDTLWKISASTGVPAETILKFNKIADVSNLTVGQVIKVPPVWVVKPGDTMWKIAKDTGVSVFNISSANGIQNPDDIRVSTILNIPPMNSSRAMYYHAPTQAIKQVALTFDDGPDNKWTPQILDILKQYNVHATFFVVGKQAVKYPQMVQRIAAEGNAIGNHSWDHSDFTKLTPVQIKTELDKTDMALDSILGYYPALFRPPYGLLTTANQQQVTSMGYNLVKWSVDTVDWSGVPVSQIMTNVNQETHPGGIILEHCFGGKGGDLSNTVQALPKIISDLKAQGYQFVTIPQLLDIPAAQ